MKHIFSIPLIFLLAACAGKVEYTPPSMAPSIDNTMEVQSSKDKVWKTLVTNLGKEFFVINNLDKDSGLINVSYSGDPQLYIDCGSIYSYVKNMRGERSHYVDGAQKVADYEVMDGNLYFIHREMSLEGRINIIVVPTTKTTTQVSVNTRYLVTKKTSARLPDRYVGSHSDTISFNSGQSATFPGSGKTTPTTCIPTGKLERDILNLVKP